MARLSRLKVIPKSSAQRDEIRLLEQMFRGAIREAGLDHVCTALHNACVHGEEFDCTQEGLGRLFDSLDGLNKAAREIEN